MHKLQCRQQHLMLQKGTAGKPELWLAPFHQGLLHHQTQPKTNSQAPHPTQVLHLFPTGLKARNWPLTGKKTKHVMIHGMDCSTYSIFYIQMHKATVDILDYFTEGAHPDTVWKLCHNTVPTDFKVNNLHQDKLFFHCCYCSNNTFSACSP